MSPIRILLASLLAVSMAYSGNCLAEDIDIYSGNASSGTPNVLFVMDNGANFSASGDACSYQTGGYTITAANIGSGANVSLDTLTPTLTGTSGGAEQCALVNAISSLPVNADGTATVSLGLMIFNANAISSAASAATLPPGIGYCVGAEGGCLIWPLTPMTKYNKDRFLNFITTWKTAGSSSPTEFNIKSAGDAVASTMQEAWAYYYGQTGISGKSYSPSVITSGCQKNFVIYIGNSFTNSSKPGEGNNDPTGGLWGLFSSNVAATNAQKAKLTDTIYFPAATCGVTSIVASTNASDWSSNWLDEWARYMYQVDASSTMQGAQNIITYTIGVIKNGTNTCDPAYPALLTNSARYGGGKYFQTGNADEVKNSILTILNEVQAVNSVFASSSLPVSVNAQGTYLNQIYMGMFRPDQGANPRWAGNLKQYSFVADSIGQLSLGDATGKGALSSAGTGFLAPDAISYWTCSNSANPYLGAHSLTASNFACPGNNDPSGGFWKNYPTLTNSAGGYYDLSDGELVEKGGAAQQIRLAYRDVTASTYTTNGGPRKVYTYCPVGTGCVGDLTSTGNAFVSTNADITATMFGASQRYKVSDITRSGTTATVTTVGNHGFATGNSVTIENPANNAYNSTFTVTVNASYPNQFTISGLTDYPTTPSAVAHTVLLSGSGTPYSAATVDPITRPGGATASNTETATMTLQAPGHTFGVGNQVAIGNTAAPYGITATVKASPAPTATSFAYDVTLTPTTPSANTYTVQRPATTVLTIASISNGKNAQTITTTQNHGFAGGETVTISGTGISGYDKSFTVIGSPAPGAMAFKIDVGSTTLPGYTGTNGRVAGASRILTLTGGNIVRSSNAVTTTATVTLPTNGVFHTGQVLQIAKSGGTSTSESAYAGNVTATCGGTCTSSGCTCSTFTYSVAVSPPLVATPTNSANPITAMISTAADTIVIGGITRSGTTATITSGLTTNTFLTPVVGATANVTITSTADAAEHAYDGDWTLTCTNATCTSATFGPVTLTPPLQGASASPQTTAYSASTPPDKASVINWLRGQDNFGDEYGPGSPVTIRPSLHGDVLHSRPMVLNYGGSTGVVVFYGDNGGVFHAINGNQVNPTGSTLPAPGNELWGFVPSEVFGKLARQRTNDPDLLLPSTPAGITPPPQKKDYFIDGPTGVYQLFDANGNTLKAILYLTMRRGGNVIYAIDVTNPLVPTVLWKADNGTLPELGQTWSTPRVAMVLGRTDPVLIFGAGYDTTEDTEPPTQADSMGRGIYILDAQTGAPVWSATYGTTTACTPSGTLTVTSGSAACTHTGLRYAVPSDITLVDRNRDGYIDRLYFGDLGGNVWRVDLQPSTSSFTAETWQIGRLASLGCSTSDCATPPASDAKARKIFFPPEMIPNGKNNSTPNAAYDAVFVVTGDREHPLYVESVSAKRNRVFMLQDLNTGNNFNTITQPIIYAATSSGDAILVDKTDCSASLSGSPTNPACSSVTTWTDYDGTYPGYYIRMEGGEKGVNAPLVVAGSVYFGTNLPKPVNAALCTTNLGEARGYRLYPFSAQYGYQVFDSGGLPPSPVAGVVQITSTTIVNGTPVTTTKNYPFAIGIGAGHTKPGTSTALDPSSTACTGADCKSAFGGQKPPIAVSPTRIKNYWYMQGK